MSDKKQPEIGGLVPPGRPISAQQNLGKIITSPKAKKSKPKKKGK